MESEKIELYIVTFLNGLFATMIGLGVAIKATLDGLYNISMDLKTTMLYALDYMFSFSLILELPNVPVVQDLFVFTNTYIMASTENMTMLLLLLLFGLIIKVIFWTVSVYAAYQFICILARDVQIE